MKKYFVVGMIFVLALCLTGSAAWSKSPNAMKQDKVLFADPQFVADYVRALATIKGKNAKARGDKATAVIEKNKGVKAKNDRIIKAANQDEKKFAAGAAVARVESDKVTKRREMVLTVLSHVPVVGACMRSRASGFNRAWEYNRRYEAATGLPGPKNPRLVALADAFFKPLSNMPEGLVASALYTPFRKNWRDMDPYSKLNAERSYAADAGVIVAKGLSMSLPGAYGPMMGVNNLVYGPIENAFVWGGMVGIPANVAASVVEK